MYMVNPIEIINYNSCVVWLYVYIEFLIKYRGLSMSAKVQKGMGERGALSCLLYRSTNLLFNSLSKIFEYLKCKASELISKHTTHYLLMFVLMNSISGICSFVASCLIM